MSSGVETSLTHIFPDMTPTADKIIVALDVATEDEALRLVHQLRDQVSRFKVGLQLYTATGPKLLQELVGNGAKVFLDLKLHDIPNTVSNAVKVAVKLGVDMLTIHLSGGEPMIQAAVEAAAGQTTILGVTVLTSQTEETLKSLGVNEPLEAHVVRLGKLGVKCGVGGLVASPKEASVLRREFRDEIRIVTPGIRPEWATAGDQKRITSPRTAIEAGADYLVIGRPIIADPDPRTAVERILSDISSP